jgi:hypothetical protein
MRSAGTPGKSTPWHFPYTLADTLSEWFAIRSNGFWMATSLSNKHPEALASASKMWRMSAIVTSTSARRNSVRKSLPSVSASTGFPLLIKKQHWLLTVASFPNTELWRASILFTMIRYVRTIFVNSMSVKQTTSSFLPDAPEASGLVYVLTIPIRPEINRMFRWEFDIVLLISQAPISVRRAEGPPAKYNAFTSATPSCVESWQKSNRSLSLRSPKWSWMLRLVSAISSAMWAFSDIIPSPGIFVLQSMTVLQIAEDKTSIPKFWRMILAWFTRCWYMIDTFWSETSTLPRSVATASTVIESPTQEILLSVSSMFLAAARLSDCTAPKDVSPPCSLRYCLDQRSSCSEQNGCTVWHLIKKAPLRMYNNWTECWWTLCADFWMGPLGAYTYSNSKNFSQVKPLALGFSDRSSHNILSIFEARDNCSTGSFFVIASCKFFASSKNWFSAMTKKINLASVLE